MLYASRVTESFYPASITLTDGCVDPSCPSREVLLAYGGNAVGVGELHGVEATFRPDGFFVSRVHTVPDTIRRVERGGLAAAVVWAAQGQFDGLSVLRIIRSIDRELPCWLVARHATRQTLEEALLLRVKSVLSCPLEAGGLVGVLRKFFGDHASDN